MYRNTKLARYILKRAQGKVKLKATDLIKWARENDHPLEAKERNSEGDVLIRFSPKDKWIDAKTWCENYRNKCLASYKQELQRVTELFSHKELAALRVDLPQDETEAETLVETEPTVESVPTPKEQAQPVPNKPEKVPAPEGWKGEIFEKFQRLEQNQGLQIVAKYLLLHLDEIQGDSRRKRTEFKKIEQQMLCPPQITEEILSKLNKLIMS